MALDASVLVGPVVSMGAAYVLRKGYDLAVRRFPWLDRSWLREMLQAERPQQIHLYVQQRVAEDPVLRKELLESAMRLPPLRRALENPAITQGARILWVDDNPDNNRWETAMFESIGIEVVSRETTRSAVGCLRQDPRGFDLILSDIHREGGPQEGVRAMGELRAARPGVDLPIIFYIRNLLSKDPPAGSQGITTDPDELLRLVIEQLERSRSK